MKLTPVLSVYVSISNNNVTVSVIFITDVAFELFSKFEIIFGYAALVLWNCVYFFIFIEDL